MSAEPAPLSMDRRAALRRKIEREAAAVMRHLKASGVVIIVALPDGAYRHVLDGSAGEQPFGGTCADTYRTMAEISEKVAAGMEGFVQ